jgi:hypothetical protein
MGTKSSKIWEQKLKNMGTKSRNDNFKNPGIKI